MIRILPLVCMAALFSGCASLSYPLPKCDGYSRRPLNRSMWEWQDNKTLTEKHSDAEPAISEPVAAAYLEEGRGLPAFARFDIAASNRPCGA
ncbi:hypothetical protein FJ987_18495 [Mesorhizobium sp. CU2]|uniref:hypothetical protein n=1 Tax=unclassified Mesorhizobium TaxID=325217 RepID=UPI0011268E3D|nr:MULTISPECIES: hypothetical protein [unclassified Mesorhizobium]TPN81022.1 hypothetical protein FJ988_19165 [Mesorhizobium sp. CU3]TPO11497.1 hypothetical protein FJ987_18495 [Mesorhizobium sp. CU2]